MVKLFISHSSEDVELASLVVQLFSFALRLRSEDIRCTSVDGYRLPGGADTDEQLRDEALAADCFLGIVSPQSQTSAYVLFELGARWGAKKHLVPLLAPGMKNQALRGPLKGLNSLSCDNMADLHQLIHEVGKSLQADNELPAAYQKYLEPIVYYATTRETPVAVPVTQPKSSDQKATKEEKELFQTSSDDDFSEAETVIAQHCEREWPDDYSMRAYCIEQQRDAVNKLRAAKPNDVPEDVFRQIRRKCAREWPDDYSMRSYSESQQIEAFRKVRPGQP